LKSAIVSGKEHAPARARLRARIDKNSPENLLRQIEMAKDSGHIVGSACVVGGGITGMQAALDLADSGYFVYLVERSSSIGGMMSQLDKTFPTNDCAM